MIEIVILIIIIMKRGRMMLIIIRQQQKFRLLTWFISKFQQTDQVVKYLTYLPNTGLSVLGLKLSCSSYFFFPRDTIRYGSALNKKKKDKFLRLIPSDNCMTVRRENLICLVYVFIHLFTYLFIHSFIHLSYFATGISETKLKSKQ